MSYHLKVFFFMFCSWSSLLNSMEPISKVEIDSLKKTIQTLDDIVQNRLQACRARADFAPPGISPSFEYDPCIESDSVIKGFSGLYDQAKALLEHVEKKCAKN